MLGNNEKVWVYIKDRKTWDKFAEAACNEGFSFGELPSEKWVFGYTVSVHSSGDMGHLPLFIWCRSFTANVESTPNRVDFRKYWGNDEDYMCKTSNFTAKIMQRV
jgi:hypothetical protein